jgi:hypothetical protein
MKHATSAALDCLSDLLNQIRARNGLQERKPGIFYRKSKSFLHFHEDPAGMYADLSVGAAFDRYPVNTKKEWKVLLSAIDLTLALQPVSGRSHGRPSPSHCLTLRQA